MATVLSILKIIGIVLLCILIVFIALILLVLFVPVRYQAKGYRKVPDEVPIRVWCKATWLLHLISVMYYYPEEAYTKVKVLGITVYSTEMKAQEKKKQSSSGEKEQNTEQSQQKEKEQSTVQSKVKPGEIEEIQEKQEQAQSDASSQEKEKLAIIRFFKKLWQILKNIKYTICKIYDKIKEVVRNIRYYIAVIESDTFQRAFQLCKEELYDLLKNILPRKLTGNFTIGTGDPANTANILAIHGMLYPLIGNYITITPDFENTIVKGDFFLKGRITVFKLLKTALKVYFNKDIKRVIQLLKKGGSKNGRK